MWHPPLLQNQLMEAMPCPVWCQEILNSCCPVRPVGSTENVSHDVYLESIQGAWAQETVRDSSFMRDALMQTQTAKEAGFYDVVVSLDGSVTYCHEAG